MADHASHLSGPPQGLLPTATVRHCESTLHRASPTSRSMARHDSSTLDTGDAGDTGDAADAGARAGVWPNSAAQLGPSAANPRSQTSAAALRDARHRKEDCFIPSSRSAADGRAFDAGSPLRAHAYTRRPQDRADFAGKPDVDRLYVSSRSRTPSCAGH
ncbi:MAG TPA: hypothetical protein VMU47_11975 [Caldimonas sp.]|nr:hypothetical protein [Caldimonas sp.]